VTGCRVRGCGDGECLVACVNPGNGADVSEIVWHDDFGQCAEIQQERQRRDAQRVRCMYCGVDFPDRRPS
jgi:hypothetical protein